MTGMVALAAASVTVPEFFVIGFQHIIPHGWDHVLFILGLFFLTRSFSVLLVQLTLFTLAHSLTLGLSLYGVISVPMQWVEVAIAMSIVFVAAENIYHDKPSRWRPAVVFLSGLIHGMGFAHAFGENRIAPGDFLPALFSYNLGIELGQIVVVGLAYAAVALWWKRDEYRKLVARPASVMIAISGIFWAVERGL